MFSELPDELTHYVLKKFPSSEIFFEVFNKAYSISLV